MLTLEQLLDATQTRTEAALALREQGHADQARAELQALANDLTIGMAGPTKPDPNPKKQDGDARTG